MSSTSGAAPGAGETDPPIVCFDGFRLDTQRRSLNRGAQKIKLTPKPFATLAFLVENRPRCVSKEELLEKIWGGTRDVSTVEHAVGRLRLALGETANEARYIETVPGQGYRFVAEVEPAAGQGGAGSARRSFRRPMAWVAMLAGLGVLGVVIAYLAIPAHVARGAWNGSTFVAMSDSGRVLWKYSFPAPLRDLPPEESAWRTQVVDLDGDGVPEVLVAAAFAPAEWAGREEIFCFSSRGRLLWRYKPSADIDFNTRDLNGPWKFLQMLVVPEGRARSIWVAVAHEVWWPAFVVRLSATGAASRVFTSSGLINVLGRFQDHADSYVLAGGINNEYRQASLAILAENGRPSTSPQTEGSEYRCIRGCPAATPFRFILFPRSELNAASDESYNEVLKIFDRPDGITIETRELPGPGGRSAFYDFSRDLRPQRVAYGGNYREMHQRFEREGRIRHSFKDCPERKSPALIRTCDGDGHWSTQSVPRVTSPD